MAPPPFPAADVTRGHAAQVARLRSRACDALSRVARSAASTRTPPHQYPDLGVGDAAGVDAAPAPADG